MQKDHEQISWAVRSNLFHTPDHEAVRRLLTPKEVADRIGVSERWVRDHASRREPRIPAIVLGDRHRVIRFRAEDIETFLAEHRHDSSAFERGNSTSKSQTPTLST